MLFLVSTRKRKKLKSSVNILKNKGDKVTTESLETLVEQLSGLTVLELSQLKKLLEEKLKFVVSRDSNALVVFLN